MKLLIDPSNSRDLFMAAKIADMMAENEAPVASPDEPPLPFGPGNDVAVTPGGVVHGATDVDSRGIPHIPEVHTGIGSKNMFKADGSWRNKRGVDDAEREAKEAEVMAEAAMTAPGAANVAPMVDPVTLPVPEAAPVVVDPIPQQIDISMDDINQVFTTLVADGYVDANKIIAAYPTMGVDPAQLLENADMRRKLYDALHDSDTLATLAPTAPVAALPGVPG